MIFTRSSSAWVLTALQTLLAFFFYYYLKIAIVGPSGDLSFSQAPTWFNTLIGLNFGLALLLALFALWKFELAGIVLLFAIHIVCPLLFFTDLTRNPYFTQIVLLNIWIAFLWTAWFWESFQNRSFVFPKTVLDLPLLCFFCATTVSLCVSFLTHEPFLYPSMFSEGLKRWLFLAINCIGAFYLAVMVEEKWRKRFIWVTFWIAGIAAAYGLMQFYGIERIWQKTLTPFANRPVSTFGNPNFLSSYLLLVIPLLTVATLNSTKNTKTAVPLLLLLIVVTGLIATMTRSTWVGALVSLMLLPCSKSFRNLVKNNAKRFVVFIVILSAGVIFWPRSKMGGYRNPLARILELKDIGSKRGYHPWDQRILIWTCSLSMLKQHLIFGKGWGLMELFYPYYQGQQLFHPILRTFRTHANNSHNEILEIWSQTGFLGMGIYVWFWVALIYFGLKLARSDLPAPHSALRTGQSSENTDRSLWGWALTSAAIGMFVDNFFGNVSLHFAVPGFLFWWQAGLLQGIAKSPPKKDKSFDPFEYRIVPIQTNAGKSLLSLGILFFFAACVFNFKREFQEIHYFRGFKISKTSNLLNEAKEELEKAWRWYAREVNSNYELANTYARLAHQSHQMGLAAQADSLRKKSLWAYCESLRSNAGYDEIFFNLGAVQSQMGWTEDNFPDFSIETPDGLTFTESANKIHGAIYNYSRALAINPLSMDGYNFLGQVFLQNIDRYAEQALMLFEQATRFFPENKDFWVNLAFLQIRSKSYEGAYSSLSRAMAVDPFYELTRKNLRSLLIQMGRSRDPLAEVDAILLQLNPLVQSKNWAQLKNLFERAVAILPGTPSLRFILANVYFELRQWDKAEKEYVEALKREPSNSMGLNNLALTYRSQGKNPEAKKMYEKLMEINPNDANARAQLQSIP